MAKQDRLDIPGRRRSEWLPRVRMDQDAFGSFAESFARWMGTAQFLMWMTVLIIAWVVWNVVFPGAPDPFPFLFLTLALSLQASYAAPLILLAANRQEARDRVSLEHDREVSAQSRADMDFLAREIASLRMRMNDVATRDFIRSELRELLEELDNREPEDNRKHIG
ncbi:MAG TPA: DUF1003 domain-containing protein [Propionicimonas sp.]|jgi:uncharacterized membrane protein